MSNLNQLRGKPEEVMLKLPVLVAGYEQDIADVEARLSLKGKTGAEAQKEQAAWPAYYGMKKAELDKLVKFVDAQVKACRGRLYRKNIENNSRDIGERGRERYIDNEPEYQEFNELYLEIEELRDKFSAITDAFNRRGFALRDWTSLKIAQMQDDII